jgi:predicted nucleic acid-binding protein
MTTGRADLMFIDTNILVYSTLDQSPLHIVAKDFIERAGECNLSLWVSRQVLREYAVVITRPQLISQPLIAMDAARHVQAFEQRFQVANEDARVTAQLRSLMISIPLAGKQIHDANIVATMLVYGIGRLLTHNIDDFKRYTHLITIDPLVDGSLAA